MQVLVRDNNVDQALKALKKKMQREGIFREMKLRNYFEKPSEKKAREKAEAVRRARKLARKKLQREGLLPSKPAAPAAAGWQGSGCRPVFGRRRIWWWRRRRFVVRRADPARHFTVDDIRPRVHNAWPFSFPGPHGAVAFERPVLAGNWLASHA